MIPLEPAPAHFSNALYKYFAATRPAFLSAALAACVLGVACARYSGVSISFTLTIVTLLLALLLHAAVNVLNDYYDALNGTDEINTGRLFPFTGGSRFIQNGVLSPRQTAVFGYGLLAVAMLGGLWLVWQSSSGLLLIGGMGVLVGWAYSAPPLKLNSRGWGEVCVWLGFVGVVVGADWVQRQGFSATPWLVGGPYGLLTTNLLFINQFPDRAADAAVGKRHWVVRLPLQSACRVYAGLAILAGLWLLMAVYCGRLPVSGLLALLPLLLSWRAARILRQNVQHTAALLPAIRLSIAAMLSHGLLLSAILLLESK